jgi:hypothetical protein
VFTIPLSAAGEFKSACFSISTRAANKQNRNDQPVQKFQKFHRAVRNRRTGIMANDIITQLNDEAVQGLLIPRRGQRE